MRLTFTAKSLTGPVVVLVDQAGGSHLWDTLVVFKDQPLWVGEFQVGASNGPQGSGPSGLMNPKFGAQ